MRFSTTEMFLLYLAIVNIISACLCAMDKSFAKSRSTRISEKTLLLISLIGGSPVMYLSMRALHHKTRHKRFMIGLPVMMIFQVVLLALAYQML